MALKNGSFFMASTCSSILSSSASASLESLPLAASAFTSSTCANAFCNDFAAEAGGGPPGRSGNEGIFGFASSAAASFAALAICAFMSACGGALAIASATAPETFFSSSFALGGATGSLSNRVRRLAVIGSGGGVSYSVTGLPSARSFCRAFISSKLASISAGRRSLISSGSAANFSRRSR